MLPSKMPAYDLVIAFAEAARMEEPDAAAIALLREVFRRCAINHEIGGPAAGSPPPLNFSGQAR